MKNVLESFVALEVAVGLLDDDVAFQQQTLDDFPMLKRETFVVRANGDVLQIDGKRPWWRWNRAHSSAVSVS